MRTRYVKTKLPCLFNVERLVTAHYFEFTPEFAWAGEKHDFWETVYVDSGAVEIRSDGDVHILEQGDLFFHQPNEFHSIRAYRTAPNVLILSFQCRSDAMERFRKSKFKANRNVKQILNRIIEEARKTFVLPHNDPSMRELKLNPDAPLGGEQMIKNLMEELFILLLRQVNEKDPDPLFLSRDTVEDRLAESMVAYIGENARRRLTVAEICQKFSYSATYLEQVFRAHTGTSLARYITAAKIALARQMLRENDLNVTQIAEALGYETPQYFSRVFRKVTHMSPSDYKRSCQI